MKQFSLFPKFRENPLIAIWVILLIKNRQSGWKRNLRRGMAEVARSIQAAVKSDQSQWRNNLIHVFLSKHWNTYRITRQEVRDASDIHLVLFAWRSPDVAAVCTSAHAQSITLPDLRSASRDFEVDVVFRSRPTHTLCLKHALPLPGIRWTGFDVRELIMARAGHYIFVLFCSSSCYLFSSPSRLFSAVADWMSTILPHMMRP